MEKYAASTFRDMEAASDRLNVHGMNVIIKWYLALYLLYHQTKIKTHSYEDYSSFKRYILLINNCFIQEIYESDINLFTETLFTTMLLIKYVLSNNVTLCQKYNRAADNTAYCLIIFFISQKTMLRVFVYTIILKSYFS